MSAICECEQQQTMNYVVQHVSINEIWKWTAMTSWCWGWRTITAITALVKWNKFYKCLDAKLQYYMLMCVCVCFVQFVAALVFSHCLHWLASRLLLAINLVEAFSSGHVSCVWHSSTYCSMLADHCQMSLLCALVSVPFAVHLHLCNICRRSCCCWYLQYLCFRHFST